MLLDDYERVSQAPTCDALREALVSFAEHMDFPLVSATLVIEQPGAPSTYVTVSNTPPAFLDASQSLEDGRRDPVLQRLRVQSTPVIYDQRTYVEASAADLWETQAPFGFRAGIGIALHLPHGRHLLLGMDREKPLPRRDAKLARMLADLNLLAVHAQDASLRLFLPPNPPVADVLPRLTPRELETLRWIAQGKSDWAIAQILQVSEHTVDFHVRQILKKMACNSRHRAVLKALQHGLIDTA
ncbi:helix-turn-helix transcriptional regulator [Aquabacterium sp.]|uniref:helix-turn-helix transcriptional regulator n=1 Tax=Aquabacterium sp. TaxID=1872578 RepID=UPI002BB27C1A|nr:LuxR C-terminal-related transcriptional regulator [Aquabacterium sp.]HSW05438.1 LuxR C-terminal-related transcriptional regulator [Aquabacterium sp.]